MVAKTCLIPWCCQIALPYTTLKLAYLIFPGSPYLEGRKEDAPTLVDTNCFLLTVVDEDVFVLIVDWMFASLFVNVVI